MRKEEIKEFIKNLEELWLKHPEQRFGQLLFNYTRFGTRIVLGSVVDPFHFQDEDILKEIEKELK